MYFEGEGRGGEGASPFRPPYLHPCRRSVEIDVSETFNDSNPHVVDASKTTLKRTPGRRCECGGGAIKLKRRYARCTGADTNRLKFIVHSDQTNSITRRQCCVDTFVQKLSRFMYISLSSGTEGGYPCNGFGTIVSPSNEIVLFL